MALPPLRKLHSQDRVVNQLQEATETVLRPVLNADILSGRLVDATLTPGVQNLVPHQLNRDYVGWLVVRNGVAGSFYEVAGDRPELYIDLRFTGASPTGIVLWVF